MKIYEENVLRVTDIWE